MIRLLAVPSVVLAVWAVLMAMFLASGGLPPYIN